MGTYVDHATLVLEMGRSFQVCVQVADTCLIIIKVPVVIATRTSGPIIFRVQSVSPTTGSLGCMGFVWWCLTAYSTPAQHPWISTEERDYIEEGLKHQSNVSNILH